MPQTTLIVRTRVLPATDFKPTRLKAEAWTFAPLTRSWDHGCDADHNHRNAAIQLLVEAGWSVSSIEHAWDPKGHNLWVARVVDARVYR